MQSADTPVRSYMDDPNTQWREGPPDYTMLNEKYLKEKKMSHKIGSLEKDVENLVKTWEMESTHKINAKKILRCQTVSIQMRHRTTRATRCPIWIHTIYNIYHMRPKRGERYLDWVTTDPEKFTLSVNHGQKFNIAKNIELGSYNVLMADSPLYDASKETSESALKLFRSAFKNGFAWELLEVYSGPPVVSFTWRHWGKWEGPYKDEPPSNETIEMYGSCVARVTEKQKIYSIEVFYDPNPLLASLMNVKHPGVCPYAHQDHTQ